MSGLKPVEKEDEDDDVSFKKWCICVKEEKGGTYDVYDDNTFSSFSEARRYKKDNVSRADFFDVRIITINFSL